MTTRPDPLITLRSLADEFGLVVATARLSNSGSLYVRLTRPWIVGDGGFRVRLSDHLPPSGRVAGWTDFRTTPRGLASLTRYLRVKVSRGRAEIAAMSGGGAS
jgi:hypothetical protein